jgi:hypothetical protein
MLKANGIVHNGKFLTRKIDQYLKAKINAKKYVISKRYTRFKLCIKNKNKHWLS